MPAILARLEGKAYAHTRQNNDGGLNQQPKITDFRESDLVKTDRENRNGNHGEWDEHEGAITRGEIIINDRGDEETKCR
jgi:hypothetical protein